MLYTRDSECNNGGGGEDSKSPQKEKAPDSQDPWEGLDDTARLCFQVMS